MDSANVTPPQGSSVDGSTVPSPAIFLTPAHATSSSLAGSNTARQLPPSSSSRTHGLNTMGKTMPSRSTPRSPAKASTDPENTYSS